MSSLSAEERRLMAGYVPDLDTELSLLTREQEAERHKQEDFEPDPEPDLETPNMRIPSSFDWRDHGVTGPIRFQDTCGSCVAFGVIAALEVTKRVQNGLLSPELDYSEAQLYFCQRASCDSGMDVTKALNVVQNSGVTRETCYEYDLNDRLCLEKEIGQRCLGWRDELTRIVSWQPIQDWQEMRWWISHNGPLVTVMSAYPDFTAYYGSGDYSKVGEIPEGGHCVSCIGYDHEKRHWICQNSMSEGWGEKGYFHVKYGEVGIDWLMWGLTP